MAKKVEGWNYEDDWSSYYEITHYRDPSGKDEEPSERPATLVIHDGDKHERVFTESEVKELLRSMMQLIDGDPEQVLAAIEAVNAKCGLGLSDPA